MLKIQLQKDQIKALKDKDRVRLETLRFILSRIKNKEIEKQKELSDEEVIEVLRKIKKELEESLDFAKKNSRNDLIEEYSKQLQILQEYLPQELSDEQLKEKVKKIIEENKEIFTTRPQALIGICIQRLKSQASPQRIAKVVQELINS